MPTVPTSIDVSADLTFDRYNCIDCVSTFQINDKLDPEIDRKGFRQAYEETANLFPVLTYMSTRGFLVDKKNLNAESLKAHAKINQLQIQLNNVASQVLNVGSPKQMQAYFYGKLKNKPYVNRSTGRPTCDDKALTRLARKPGDTAKSAKLCQQIRGLKKLTSTYLDVKTDSDSRLRCFWKPRGTYTGRLSSSKTIFQTGMNFQNLDPRFQSFLVADPGYVIIELDKRQAEWVVSAYASGDERMIEVFESGIDPHLATGMDISGLSAEDVKAESKLLGHVTDPEEIRLLREKHMPWIFERAKFLPRIFSVRQGGKKSNHGLNYVMRYRRFALENEMPERDAENIVIGYHNAYPRLTTWWDEINTQLKLNRTVENCLGRHIRFIGPLGHDLLGKAIAFIPQSTVGVLVNNALIAAYNDRAELPQFDPLSQVHDSIKFQVPVSDLDAIIRTINGVKRYLEPTLNYRGRDFVIPTDCKLGLNCGHYDPEANPTGMFEIEINEGSASLLDELKKVKELQQWKDAALIGSQATSNTLSTQKAL